MEKKYNLDKGLYETIQWYLDNPIWIKNIDKKKYSSRLGNKI